MSIQDRLNEDPWLKLASTRYGEKGAFLKISGVFRTRDEIKELWLTAKKYGEEDMAELIKNGNTLDVDHAKLVALYNGGVDAALQRRGKTAVSWDDYSGTDILRASYRAGLMTKAHEEFRKLYKKFLNNAEIKKEKDAFNKEYSHLKNIDEWGYIMEGSENAGNNKFTQDDVTQDDDMKQLIKKLESQKKYIPETVRDHMFDRSGKKGDAQFPYFPPLLKAYDRGTGFAIITEWDGECIDAAKGLGSNCTNRQNLMNDWIAASNFLKKKVKEKHQEKRTKYEELQTTYMDYPPSFFEFPLNISDDFKYYSLETMNGNIDDTIFHWIYVKKSRREENKEGYIKIRVPRLI
jgi:hypothetical protein